MNNFNPELGIHQLLNDITHILAAWLHTHLSHNDPQFWENNVLPGMTYAQSRYADANRVKSLNALDLTALLRILDYNWHLVTQIAKLDYYQRHYIKEALTVRNRWAHTTPESVDKEMLYRDADTLQRLAELLGAPPSYLEKAQDIKKQLSHEIHPPLNSEPSATEISEQATPTPVPETSNSGIQIGNMVFLKSNPSRQGAVVGITGTDDTTRYQVFLDNKTQQFYDDQIGLVMKPEVKPLLSVEELHSFITTLQLRNPSLSTLYSLNASRIDFVPYQYRPVLKIIRADRPRLLIADGVGVGKTIEAGLILRELQARGTVERILIICPKPLVAERKWELEMKRFDERFTALTSAQLQYCIEETDKDGEWPERHAKAIIPYSLFDQKLLMGEKSKRRHRLGLYELAPPPYFDLVIVDEAHHIRNENTYAHQCVRFFCDNAHAVVFLTATPVQLHNAELYTLLRVLRPDLIVDEVAFEHIAEPNPSINLALRHVRACSDAWREETHAALLSAAQTARGIITLRNDPEFNAVLKLLEQDTATREERVELIHRIEAFHSFATVINRTRRRDIGDFCVRKPYTVEITHTQEQQRLYDATITLVEKALSLKHNPLQVHFMTTTIRRQAASCLYGLAPRIRGLIEGRLEDYDPLDAGEYDGAMEIALDTALRHEMEDLIALAETLPEKDPKFDAFLDVVHQKQKMSNNKVLLFSTFRHTLAYLEKRLLQAGIRVALVHGDVPDDTRQLVRKRFETSPEDKDAVDVLLMSEVGCEGLDYQFCDTMVNYDLPWNPMRIEQRIGRIDRRGQQSETVSIYNLITGDTIDADIYYRCLWRIGIFESSVGDCEDIFGNLQATIENIAKNAQLTPEEKRRKLEQLADNEIRRMKEENELEEKEAEFFGLQVSRNAADAAVYQAESRWLAPQMLEGFLTRYISNLTRTEEPFLGKGPLKTLRLSQDARQILREQFIKLKPAKNEMNRLWERYLKGQTPHCQVTFDGTCAADNRDALFINPLHPLVQQAVQACNPALPARTAFKVYPGNIAAGIYPFVLYAWEFKGARTELKLTPICDDEGLTKDFFVLLEEATPCDHLITPAEEAAFDRLDALHYRHFQEAREAHQKAIHQRCIAQRDSLETSFRNHESVLLQRLETATDPNIIRMRQGELDNRRADHARTLEQLAQTETTADVLANPVLQGILTVADTRGNKR